MSCFCEYDKEETWVAHDDCDLQEFATATLEAPQEAQYRHRGVLVVNWQGRPPSGLHVLSAVVVSLVLTWLGLILFF